MMDIYELGERVLSELYRENTGNQHQRKSVVCQRALDALIDSVLGEVV